MNECQTQKLLVEFLQHNKNAIHPGRGIKDARLVRKVCNELGLDEDDFLQDCYKRDKKKWGL